MGCLVHRIIYPPPTTRSVFALSTALYIVSVFVICLLLFIVPIFAACFLSFILHIFLLIIFLLFIVLYHTFHENTTFFAYILCYVNFNSFYFRFTTSIHKKESSIIYSLFLYSFYLYLSLFVCIQVICIDLVGCSLKSFV